MLQVTRAPLRNSNGYSITRASFNPLDVQVSLKGILCQQKGNRAGCTRRTKYVDENISVKYSFCGLNAE